jgi:hypothetical protein
MSRLWYQTLTYFAFASTPTAAFQAGEIGELPLF